MLKKIKKFNDRGDTIIEVLFAIVVIGIVLSGGYGVVTRSIIVEEDAQQHTFALGLVQTQIELIRAYVTQNNTAPAFVPNAACMVDTQNVITHASVSSDCQHPLNSTTNYTLSIQSSSNLYTIEASWPSLITGTGNSGNDQISIPYRIQPNGG